VVRTITNITRVFTYNAPKALVVRGTAAQIQLAEWLVRNSNSPPLPPLMNSACRAAMPTWSA
jgi:hypothetical protein